MTNVKVTCDEINDLTGKLIELGLCDDQNYAVRKMVGKNREEISFDGCANLAYILKAAPYRDIYGEIKRNRDYNVAFPDGGLLQIQYIFQDDEVTSHRLAFFPSPNLIEFQNDPELYEMDAVYADILDVRIVVTPIRFDFDAGSFVQDTHPMGHVTLGQYSNCRIPMASALGPFRFVEFVLGAFYNTIFRNYREHLVGGALCHPRSITDSEAKRVHFMFDCR